MTFTTGRMLLSEDLLMMSTGLVLPCSEPTTGSRLASQTVHCEKFMIFLVSVTKIFHGLVEVCQKQIVRRSFLHQFVGIVFNEFFLSHLRWFVCYHSFHTTQSKPHEESSLQDWMRRETGEPLPDAPWEKLSTNYAD